MRFSIALTLAFTVTISASAADWGHLQMRFVYDGEPPQPKLVKVGASGEIPDESLIVNRRDRGIQNVFVWLFPAHNESVEVHPDYAQTAAGKVAMKIVKGRFEPHIAIVCTTQTLIFQNADTAGYNVKFDTFNNNAFTALLPTGGSASATFTAEENSPVHVWSVIQPWLLGLILVRDNPYFALSDEHGRLEIKNIPTGKHTFIVWHEKVGFVQTAVHNGKPVAWSRGRLTLEIQPGENNLGEIKLSPEQFKQ